MILLPTSPPKNYKISSALSYNFKLALTDRMVADLKARNSVNEAMKARDQMGWVQAVNSFTQQAEEIVLTEIVYK